MTASIVSSPARVTGRTPGRFAGFAPLVRKDLAEWRHSKRLWVILIAATAFMALTAANGAITTWLITNVPTEGAAPTPASLVPMDNLMAAAASQFVILVAVFAVMSLLVAEREHGTLSWVASKPVSRGAIWLSKWAAATIVVTIVGGLIPLAITVALVFVLYGPVSIGVALIIAVGMAAAITFIVAVVLAASTAISNQAAVAAIGLAVLFLPPILAGLSPVEIMPFLATSISSWTIGIALGVDVGFITPIAWAVSIIALVAFATWRMDRIEL